MPRKKEFNIDTNVCLEDFGKVDDVTRGRLSGIPFCCIAFFEDLWKHHSEFLQDYLRLTQWGYVPCPACKATGNRVELIRHVPKRVLAKMRRARKS